MKSILRVPGADHSFLSQSDTLMSLYLCDGPLNTLAEKYYHQPPPGNKHYQQTYFSVKESFLCKNLQSKNQFFEYFSVKKTLSKNFQGKNELFEYFSIKTYQPQNFTTVRNANLKAENLFVYFSLKYFGRKIVTILLFLNYLPISPRFGNELFLKTSKVVFQNFLAIW